MVRRAPASSSLLLCLLLSACSGSDAGDDGTKAPDLRAGATVWSEADGGNAHSYRLVVARSGITWANANAAAAKAGGYLATVSSDAENAFITELSAPEASAWLLITADAAPGTFLGPWLGASAESARWSWVTDEDWSYTAWAAGEPTGTYNGNVEDKLILKGATDAGGVFTVTGWNDATDFAAPSYVVEFE
jgi:hypothetical protein